MPVIFEYVKKGKGYRNFGVCALFREKCSLLVVVIQKKECPYVTPSSAKKISLKGFTQRQLRKVHSRIVVLLVDSILDKSRFEESYLKNINSTSNWISPAGFARGTYK